MFTTALIIKCRILKWDYIEMPLKPNEIIFIKIGCININTTIKLKIIHCKNNHVGIACLWGSILTWVLFSIGIIWYGKNYTLNICMDKIFTWNYEKLWNKTVIDSKGQRKGIEKDGQIPDL